MKKLPLTSPAYKYIEKSFGQWLDVLGYAEQSVYSMPIYVRALLHYLEQRGKHEVKDITAQLVRDYYYNHLKNRANTRWGGALSNNHLNKHIQAFNKFFDYLRQSGRQTLPTLNIPMEENDAGTPTVLTEPEIKSLFAACDQYSQPTRNSKPDWFYPAMALRDKAMLSVYYSCALRRTEGVSLELSDVLFEKQILHVRKGKNNKERFVPISRTALQHLEVYLYDARPFLLKSKRSEYFFINERGNPMSTQMMIVRLHTLLARTENPTLIEKYPGLHTLRHSIATHLLANGMKLEKIKDFLGHSSLESTQIYTHLIEVENGDTNTDAIKHYHGAQAGKVF
jgi:integrase/recombinase XerD